jgi:hypothetical protein
MRHENGERGVSVAVTACLLSLAILAAPGAPGQQDDPAGPKRPPETDPGPWEEVQELYERAKEAGEDVPKNVYDWSKSDLQAIGDWEYLVADLEESDAATLETKLNELGRERWEVIWIQPAGARTRFILKRPVRTYLQHIPLSQLLKLLPTGGE